MALEDDLGMVPLSEALLREVQRGVGDAALSARAGAVFEFLTPAVESWVRALSHGSTVAFLETEYFGGEGFERSETGTSFSGHSTERGP